ncbi:hypothetical protein ColTof4_09278 [Colletotrichum tofieldiae]|nr:hypothetical protein ColTof4_09278 [Colletotrichum tofieldiae]
MYEAREADGPIVSRSQFQRHYASVVAVGAVEQGFGTLSLAGRTYKGSVLTEEGQGLGDLLLCFGIQLGPFHRVRLTVAETQLLPKRLAERSVRFLKACAADDHVCLHRDAVFEVDDVRV